MSHETDHLISKDQVSNQKSFHVWHVAACLPVLNVFILSIGYRPICASTESSLLLFVGIMFSLCLKYSPTLCCAKVSTRSSFLVTCKHSVCVVVPPFQIHTHSSLLCARHQQEGEGKQRAHFLCVQPVFYTMEQDVPGNCKRGHGVWRKDKVVSPSYKLVFLSLLPLSCLSFSITLSVRAQPASVYFPFVSFSKRIKQIVLLL